MHCMSGFISTYLPTLWTQVLHYPSPLPFCQLKQGKVKMLWGNDYTKGWVGANWWQKTQKFLAVRKLNATPKLLNPPTIPAASAATQINPNEVRLWAWPWSRRTESLSSLWSVMAWFAYLFDLVCCLSLYLSSIYQHQTQINSSK